MKRLIVLMLVCTMLFAACTVDESVNSNSSQTESVDEKTVVEKALELVDQEKYEEAYSLLYKNRGNEEAKDMLEDFTVVHTNETLTSYEIYNAFIEKTYNENGDIIKGIQKMMYQGMYYVYDLTYEYTYDEKGRVLSQSTYVDGSENPDEIVKYTYDENGNLVLEEKTNNSYDYTTGELSTTYTEYTAREYDENGNVTYSEEYYIDEGKKEIIVCEENTYDENGNLIHEKWYNTEDNYYDTEFVYDENGFLVKEIEKRSYGVNVTEYTVNEKGDALTTKITFNYDGKENGSVITSEFETVYEYDEEGRQTKVVNTYSNDTSTSKEYVYNEQGDIIKQTEIDIEGKVNDSRFEYEYFENGKVRKETNILNRFGKSSMRSEYDEHGNAVREYTDENERTYEYTYNEQGLIATKLQTLDGQQMFEYTYDANGNIIKEIRYNPKTPDDKIEYTYTYDDKNNRTTYSVTNNGITDTDKFTYVYDEAGRMLEKTTVTYTGSENKTTYEYDANGNQIKVSWIDKDGNIGGYIEHTYDEDNNLIKTVRLYSDRDNEMPYTVNYTYNENGILISELTENLDYAAATLNEYSDLLYLYTPKK